MDWLISRQFFSRLGSLAYFSFTFFIFAFAFAFVFLFPVISHSQDQDDRISNQTAIFSGIDKITGRITTFSASIDETVQFDKLEITPRVCYTSLPTQRAKTTSFVEINDLVLVPDQDARDRQRIFTGWMFAESPGINGVEHAVNDVWLIDCEFAASSE